MIVVSDTTPLHYLILCEVVEVLPKIFRKVVVPPAVHAELSHPNAPTLVKRWMTSSPEWLTVQVPQAIKFDLNLDRGEVEAISLAEELGASLILMDDLKGRTAAGSVGFVLPGPWAFSNSRPHEA